MQKNCNILNQVYPAKLVLFVLMVFLASSWLPAASEAQQFTDEGQTHRAATLPVTKVRSIKQFRTVFYCADTVSRTGQCPTGWRPTNACILMTKERNRCRGQVEKITLCGLSAGPGHTTCFSKPYISTVCQARITYDRACVTRKKRRTSSQGNFSPWIEPAVTGPR